MRVSNVKGQNQYLSLYYTHIYLTDLCITDNLFRVFVNRRCCKNKCSNKSNSDDQLDSCRDHCEEEASCSEASSSSDSGGGSCSSKIRRCCHCLEEECSMESGDSADGVRTLHMFIFVNHNI